MAIMATNQGIDGDTAAFESTAAQLDENSVALSEMIGSVYGAEAGDAFLAQWRAHIGFFVDYTTAKAADDQAGQDKAVADLGTYITDFAAFLAGPTGLPEEALAASLNDHVGQLKSQLDSYAEGDHETAATLTREAYAHMFMTGAVLADGIIASSPDAFDASGPTTGDPAVELRVALDRLLSEHFLLAAYATRAGLDGAPSFDALAGVLDANSVELSAAIGSVYGPEAEEAFLGQWRAHIGFFVDYTVAKAGDDQPAQDAAVADLGGYITDFAGFLAGATDLPADALETTLNEHVMHLKDQLDAYAEGDHAAADDLLAVGSEHMAMTGDVLAQAIAAQDPEMLR